MSCFAFSIFLHRGPSSRFIPGIASAPYRNIEATLARRGTKGGLTRGDEPRETKTMRHKYVKTFAPGAMRPHACYIGNIDMFSGRQLAHS